MNHNKIPKIAIFLVILNFLIVQPYAYGADILMVDDPWIRQSPPTSMANAGYLTLTNRTNQPQIIVAASSPSYGSVQLHTNIYNKQGLMQMKTVAELIVKAGESVVLEPGKLHLMLMKAKQQIKASDHVAISFSFKDGSKQLVHFTVRR